MKILALDSSGLVASVAVCQDDVMLAEYTTNDKKTHSQTLLPMIAEIMHMLHMEASSVDAIAVAAGPGSFTGLRIGCATAKGLGLAWEKPIIPVPTVDALAYNLVGTKGLVCPMMDARRQQVYTGIYRLEDGSMEQIMPQTAMPVEELTKRLNSCGERVTLLGDGLPVYSQLLETALQVPFMIAPSHLARQRAGAVAALGMKLFREGIVQTADEHTPVYLRMSQAERERSLKEAGK